MGCYLILRSAVVPPSAQHAQCLVSYRFPIQCMCYNAAGNNLLFDDLEVALTTGLPPESGQPLTRITDSGLHGARNQAPGPDDGPLIRSSGAERGLHAASGMGSGPVQQRRSPREEEQSDLDDSDRSAGQDEGWEEIEMHKAEKRKQAKESKA
jgi:hypothetical protein